MGAEENLRKLNEELQKEIKEERQVFCVMARIRKALEHHNLKDEYKVLNFYCNWVLHTKLDRSTDVAKEILGKEDPDINNLMSFLGFDHFKGELQNFIKAHSLTKMEEGRKKLFIKFLKDILIDTPLIILFLSSRVEFKFIDSEIGNLGSLTISRS